MKQIPISELMTEDFFTIAPQAPLSEVVMVMANNRVRSMPVTEADGSLVGIISETDLFLKERNAPFSTQKVPTLLGRIIDEHEIDQLDVSKRIPVREVMRREVETVGRATTLEEAAMKMMRLGITNLPVVEDGRVVGVLRRIDILRTIFGESSPDLDNP
jgi:CBS domain-containing protein